MAVYQEVATLHSDHYTEVTRAYREALGYKYLHMSFREQT